MTTVDAEFPLSARIACGVTIVVLCPFSIAWRAWVALQLLSWFAVPFGLPTIQLGHVMGLLLLFAFIQAKPSGEQPKPVVRILSDLLVYGFLSPLIALGVGWVIRAVAL